MEPITVRFNGALTVDSITETPDETLTCGEFLDAVIEAHQVPGEHGHEFVLDGEPVPDGTPVAALSGETVVLRALPGPEIVETALPADEAADVVDQEPVPYDQWQKADLWAEILARREAGQTVECASSATKPEMVAALEADDQTRPDAVFVEGEPSAAETTTEQGAQS